MIRFPRLAFSLRTLVIAVLLIGSAFGLWWRWEPWALHFTVKRSEGSDALAFSFDSNQLVVSGHHASVIDLATGAVVTELLTENGGYLDDPRWSRDGKWLQFWDDLAYDGKICFLWDTQHWTDWPIAEWDAKTNRFVATEEGRALGYGKIRILPRDMALFDTESQSKRVRGAAGAVVVRNAGGETSEHFLATLQPPGPKWHRYFRGAMSRNGDWIGACCLEDDTVHIYSVGVSP